MSKASGYTDQAVGAVKETVGHATGNHSLEAKGSVQKNEGKVEVEAVKGKERAKGASEETWGAIKETVGSITGNHDTEAQGKLEKEKGKLRQEANQ
eukprot:TRINITY_DN203_c0_g1_i1.p1 TRINITY_DN203_c0_g1~~TRINITY_DN203_c0_g1_i1.p1  ORF type:complete len:107 (-),score=48.64 TRINITY_DN203_c0_g1_i1:83-370(-)